MNLWYLIPLAVFLAAAFLIVIVVRRRASSAGSVDGYFIGNRALGGFVLAMTTIATYGSVSSFVGGPGQAFEVGYGWVYMATVQVCTLIVLFAVFGKKMALVSRRIDAVTVVDVLRARFGSDALASLSAVIIVVFFAATMVAQFVGGAKLFEAVTGVSYVVGLALFGVVAIVFTGIGGFRGVAITDALCGVVMCVGIVMLAVALIVGGGGWDAVMDGVNGASAGLGDPLGAGKMPLSLYFTQWLLVGIFTYALPQSLVRTMGFRDMRAMKRACVWGTVIIGAMMIGVTMLGVLAHGVLPEPTSAYGTVDDIIPAAIVASMPRGLAAVVVIGPVAASISTVSSLLISASSAIVGDLWARRRPSEAPSERRVVGAAKVATFVIGAIVLLCSIVPPDVIWKINMFAFGGLESAFCWVVACGLFWRRATKIGALSSMVSGVAAYCICMGLAFRPFDLHQIVIGVSVSFAAMVVGSLLSRHDAGERADVFFPETPREA